MKHLLLTASLAALTMACSAAQGSVSASSTSRTQRVMCTQVYGALYNPTTRECRIYRNGCEQSDLKSQGFTQEISPDSCANGALRAPR